MLMRILSDDLDRMAETFGFGRSLVFRDLMQQGRMGMWSPQIEVSEDERRLTVRADLPGRRPLRSNQVRSFPGKMDRVAWSKIPVGVHEQASLGR